MYYEQNEDTLEALGIYADRLTDTVNETIEFFEEVNSFLKGIGASEIENRRLYNAIDEYQQKNFDYTAITESIVNAYLNSAALVVNNDIVISKLGIKILVEPSSKEYVDDNTLFFSTENGEKYEASSCDVTSVLQKAFAQKIIDKMKEKISAAEISVDSVLNAIDEGEIEFYDYTKLTKGETTTTIKNFIEKSGDAFIAKKHNRAAIERD